MSNYINRFGDLGEIDMALISQLTQHLNTGTVAVLASMPEGQVKTEVALDFNQEDYVQQLINWDIL